MKANPLTPRFSEAAFRRYEALLQKVVENHPQPTQFEPRTLSAETVAARFRDACRSYAENKWQSNIDRLKFDTIFPMMTVHLDGLKIKIDFEKRQKPTSVEIQQTQRVAHTFANVQPKDIEHILYLVERGFLSPIRLHLPSHDAVVELNTLSEFFDVQVQQEQQDYIII